MSRTPWTAIDLALLRQHYGRMPAGDLAEGLERSLVSVYQRARIEGLGQRLRPWTDAETETLRQRNREGWTDTEIAGELKRDRHRISARRKAMGLPSHEKGERWRQAISAGVKRQCERLGLSAPTELRTRAFRLFALANGWPEDLRPREVQILNVLAARGVPMTRLELAAAIGMRTDREDRPGHLAIMSGNGPGGTYTASLLRRGLIAKLKRAASGFGYGANRDLYFLAPAALAILEERARCQQS
jgi:hypothetical protein